MDLGETIAEERSYGVLKTKEGSCVRCMYQCTEQ